MRDLTRIKALLASLKTKTRIQMDDDPCWFRVDGVEYYVLKGFEFMQRREVGLIPRNLVRIKKVEDFGIYREFLG